jgi:hypothetical protein
VKGKRETTQDGKKERNKQTIRKNWGKKESM